jgi:RNA polymerase sigma factor (sigma-70 family)
MSEQDQFLAEAMEREEPRLRSFIRKRVLDTSDAEDVLQDVFYELIAAYRMMQPVEQVTAWMFRVARNRITDLFRRRKTVSMRWRSCLPGSVRRSWRMRCWEEASRR